MRSSLGKAFVGTAVAVAISLGALGAAGPSFASTAPQAPPITNVAQVTYQGETLSQSVDWHPVRVTTPASYTVVAGDTLTAIAARECVTASDWPGLYIKNQGLIGANFNSLRIGWQLTVSCDPTVVPPAPPAPPAPAPRPKVVATAAVAPTRHTAPATTRVSTAGYGSFEACVIKRESGGNPNVMNGSAHYGLFQFSRSTWIAYGGNPADFGHASAAEQEAVFATAMARGGESNWAPYDGC